MVRSEQDERSLAELELALVAGAWRELGVSGWSRTHGDWAIDPEPLIIRTAELADEDARLRDEALDWCIHYWRYISRTRLRGLLRKRSDEAAEAWGRFAATVNEHSIARWPNATDPMPYKITGRSSMPSMEQPSRAWLRLRATFGVGARAEILRYFLSGRTVSSTALIAEHAQYAKRNIDIECDSLEKAGVLRRRKLGNRYLYSLVRADALREFAGEIAPIRPSWSALLTVTAAFVGLENTSHDLPDRVLMVESFRILQSLEDALDALDIEDRPRFARPQDHWPEIRRFAAGHLSAWAAGDWVPKDR
ncbi:hypothetical protein FB561_3352 [Kribbella amoyensis]|uniref:Uncharacterized protein n=1 Tax=Kribbella amoyensis TaxID=996641 RepID=A0A561BTK5_9ACTN|nr:hypothetical protein [Kribbella amoyensis]TWD82224.1 hypothetical protein FB561_3352 [Kribbella amoyensis]